MRWKPSGSQDFQDQEPGSQERPLGGGAWYADPYGRAAERWWDGHRWTQEVRELSEPGDADDLRARRADGTAARAVSRQTPTEPWLSMAHVVGKKLQILSTGRATEEQRDPERTWGASAFALAHVTHGYEVVTPAGRVGFLDLAGRTELARLTSADGVWCLQKRQPRGWELTIQSAVGEHVGWYSGRHWLPGGVISLTDGTQIEMRRSLGGRWKLHAADNRQAFAEIWREQTKRKIAALTLRSLPPNVSKGSLVVLTGCAVVILEWTMASTPAVTGSA